MRIAALYDVHGNLHALEAVLAELEREPPDLILFGGDLVLGPFPEATLDRIVGLGRAARLIRGNTDRVVVDPPREAADPSPAWAERRRWVAARLGASHHEVLRRLPEHAVLDVDGLGETLFCHGSPRSDEEIVTRFTSEARLREILAGVGPRAVVLGHTHVQFDRRSDDIRVVNPGSVGMPYEGEPGAYWAMLGPEVSLRSTAYDFEAAAAAIAASGFPGGEEFARRIVLEPAGPEEISRHFESMAVERAATGWPGKARS